METKLKTQFSTNGERNVNGEITDESGSEHDFNDQWDGREQISNESDDDVSMDLNTA